MDTITEEELELLKNSDPELAEKYAAAKQRQDERDAEQKAIEEEELRLKQKKQEEKLAKQKESEQKGFFEKAYETVEPYVTPAIQAAEGFGTGVAQGFTSGGAEEVLGGIGAATGLGDYETVKKEQEQIFKKTEEENPILYPIGEFVGSVGQGAAVTAVTGGLGLPIAVTNALSKLKKITDLTKIIYKPIGTVVKPVSRIAGTAAIGATEGIVQEALKSEKSLEEQAKEGFKDVETAAKSGALIGGVLQAAATGVEGVGNVIAKKYSKVIEQEKLPPIFNVAVKAYNAGKEGMGYASERSMKRPVENLIQVIENDIQPKIQNAMRETKELSDYILSNVPKKIDINDTVEDTIKNLKQTNNPDADKLANLIEQNYKKLKESAESRFDAYGNPTNLSPKIPLIEAKILKRKAVQEIYDNPQTNAKFKELVFKMGNSIDNAIGSAVTDSDAIEAVLKDPEQAYNFYKILRKADPKALASEIIETSEPVRKIYNNKKAILKSEEALKKAKNLDPKNLAKSHVETISKILEPLDNLDPNLIPQEMSKLLQDPVSKQILIDAGKQLGPIKVLDSKMHRILNSQKLLTGQADFPITEVEKAEQVTDIFRTLAGLAKEGTPSDIKQYKVNKALEQLAMAFPEMEKDITTKLKPLLDDLQVSVYLHGAGLSPALKDSALVQSVVGGKGKPVVQAANIAAQTFSAANKGAPGPIVGLPTSLVIQPSKVALRGLKNRVDSMFNINSNNKKPNVIGKMISDRLENALNSDDESRRIAILNTLMQYETFREIAKEEEDLK